MAAAMKHMVANFSKLNKFEGVDFRRWRKKMHFCLSTMSVVYVLNIPNPDKGDDGTVEQIRRRNKWVNDDYVCRGINLNSIFTQHKMNMDEVIQVFCVIDKLSPSWNDFKHTLKHKKEESILVELGSHLHIEESLRVQDSDEPKGNNVVYYVTYVSEAFFMQDDDVALWVDSGATIHVCKDKMLALLCLFITKDEALDKFKVFKTEVELQQVPLIKRFRTDKGGEYMDTLYFQSVSIIYETTTPYTLQQNGIFERKNKVLKEMVNSMLSYSGLSQGF
ncbi:zinc finger, CCHC-type containing protein [Tanacetum coccineum]